MTMQMLLARRRMMMPQGDPYVAWLKSIGCVVYLPLSADGDLTDRISGLSLQLSGNGSLTWDSGEGMYKVTTPSVQFQYAASLENGMTASDFPSNSFTTMLTFKKITNSGYPSLTQIAPKSTDDNTITSMCVNWNASNNISNFPAYAVKLAKSESSTERNYYQEGALYTTLSPLPQILPANWSVTSGGGLILGFVRRAQAEYYNKEYYIKDIYLFDGELTLSQIRHIQGYE